MKVFNHLKWEAIQRRRDDLFQVLRNITDQRNDARDRFANAFGHVHSQQSAYGLRKACEVVSSDDKYLSVSEIETKIKRLAGQWPVVCEEYGLKEASDSKNVLINLYRLMREKKRLQKDYEIATEAVQNFGACFNTLNEFAEKHGKGDRTKFNAAPVIADPYAGFSRDLADYAPVNLA